LGGSAGTLSSSADGFGTESSPVAAPFIARFVGRPPEFLEGRGGGTGAELSAGLTAETLLRFGGRAGDS